MRETNEMTEPRPSKPTDNKHTAKNEDQSVQPDLSTLCILCICHLRAQSFVIQTAKTDQTAQIDRLI